MGYVLAIFTGGTISFVKHPGDPDTRSLSALGSRDLLPTNLHLPDGVSVRTADPYRTMSESLTWTHVKTLVSTVQTAMADPDLIGIVISHGTDTMEEVSYLLDLVHPWPKPIVFTGAMRHRTLPAADGDANLRDAIAVALAKESSERGVVVVMNQEIHAARYVSKEHSTNLASFGSPGRGPMGGVIEGRVRYEWMLPAHPTYYTIPALQPRVELIRLGLSPSAMLFEACLHMGAQGVVIEGFGAGHVSEVLMDILAKLSASMPVWVVPRTAAGPPLLATYTYPGSEHSLLQMGIRLVEGPGIKARLRMMLEIGRT